MDIVLVSFVKYLIQMGETKGVGGPDCLLELPHLSMSCEVGRGMLVINGWDAAMNEGTNE